jgi:hypothetical protein
MIKTLNNNFLFLISSHRPSCRVGKLFTPKQQSRGEEFSLSAAATIGYVCAPCNFPRGECQRRDACDAVAFVFALLSPPFLLYYKMRRAKIKHSKTLTQHEIMRESMKRCVKQSSLLCKKSSCAHSEQAAKISIYIRSGVSFCRSLATTLVPFFFRA